MRPKLYGRRHPCHPGSRLRIIYHPDLDQGQGGRQLQQFRMLLGAMRVTRCELRVAGYGLCVARCGFCSAIQNPQSKIKLLCHLSSVIRPQSSDNLSQAALALAVFLSLPDSTFPVEDGGAPRKRAIRSSRGGWVENKLIKLRPDNGLTINM